MRGPKTPSWADDTVDAAFQDLASSVASGSQRVVTEWGMRNLSEDEIPRRYAVMSPQSRRAPVGAYLLEERHVLEQEVYAPEDRACVPEPYPSIRDAGRGMLTVVGQAGDAAALLELERMTMQNAELISGTNEIHAREIAEVSASRRA